MTRIGRFVAGVGAVVLGILVTKGYYLVVAAIDPEPGTVWAILLGLAGFALFAVVTAALYTWAVDGPFVRRRPSSS